MTLQELINKVESTLRTEHAHLFKNGHYDHDLDAVLEVTISTLSDVSVHDILVMLSLLDAQYDEWGFNTPFVDNEFPYDLYNKENTTIRDLLVWSVFTLISGEIYNRCDKAA